jgi:DNA-binding transcriptional MerR regulator
MDTETTPDRLRSGGVAARCGVSPDTLRHYERLGLIPPPERSAAGYRLYPAEVCDRVRVVRAALSVGFTLAELAAIVRMRARGEAPCRSVRSMAAAKLEGLETRLAELDRLRERLRSLLSDWDARLTDAGGGERAHLLESLAAGTAEVTVSPNVPAPLARPRTRNKRSPR